jgi:peptidoglycan/xylan/chitin deacetylase (PgdA/CDA1 family)
MRVDRSFSLYVVRPLIRAGLLALRPGIPILMYHSISDDQEGDRGDYYKVCTSPRAFRQQLQTLHDAGFRVCDLDSALEELGGSIGQRPAKQASDIADGPSGSGNGRSAGEKLAVITFDDGFRDFYSAAWPALAEFGFTATVFLPTKFIGTTRCSFQGRDCLTWDEVRALRDAGAHFGSHTVSHPILAELDESALEHELAQSKRTIEEQIGEPISSFSHPYAFPLSDPGYIERFRRCLSVCGYRVGLTTTLGRARPGDDPLLLKRLPLNGADDCEFFLAKLSGAYDWLELPQRAIKELKGLGRAFGKKHGKAAGGNN